MSILDQAKRAVDVHVGMRIAQRRFALKLTAGEVALQLGLSPDALIGIEMGNTPVTAPVLVDLCTVLKVKPSWFFKGFDSY